MGGAIATFRWVASVGSEWFHWSTTIGHFYRALGSIPSMGSPLGHTRVSPTVRSPFLRTRRRCIGRAVKRSDVHRNWVPDAAPWSLWVKPVLFASLDVR
jgi:hypothetical protein